jgi:hypothetical protein
MSRFARLSDLIRSGTPSKVNSTIYINKYFQKIYGKKYEDKSKGPPMDFTPSESRSRMPTLQDIKYRTMPSLWKPRKQKKEIIDGTKKSNDAQSKILTSLKKFQFLKPESLIQAEQRAKSMWANKQPSASSLSNRPFDLLSLSKKKGTIPQLITMVTKTIRTVRQNTKDINSLNIKLKTMRKEATNIHEPNISIKSARNLVIQNSKIYKKRVKKKHSKSEDFMNVFKRRFLPKRLENQPTDDSQNTMYMFLEKQDTNKDMENKNMRRTPINEEKPLPIGNYNTSPLKIINYNSKLLDVGSKELYISRLYNDTSKDEGEEEYNKCIQVVVSPPKIRNASLNHSSLLQQEKRKNMIKL